MELPQLGAWTGATNGTRGLPVASPMPTGMQTTTDQKPNGHDDAVHADFHATAMGSR